MSVKIGIPPFLIEQVNNNKEVVVEGRTVGEALQSLIKRYPKIEKIILDKDGKLLRHIDVYVNGISIFPEELTKPIKDGDELYIVNIIVGG